ncbi:MAG: hypothetical protein JNK74_03065 [Candidatus Hydrogenedentes bacterium]|nr:hypothetical protein [Candidatus Hydrogenedentota bacterium]
MPSIKLICANSILLILVCTAVGGDSLDSGSAILKDRQRLEQIFSQKEVDETFKQVVNLWEAHGRLYEAFVGDSNLSKFDTGTNDNPWIFVGDGQKELPADATITLTLSKQEFIDLKLPGWERMNIGGPNNLAFLKAWMAYQSYENVRLRLELLKLKTPDAEPAQRAELEAAMAKYEKEIVTYLEAPGAD